MAGREDAHWVRMTVCGKTTRGKQHVLVIECDTIGQAIEIAWRARRDAGMTRVQICHQSPGEKPQNPKFRYIRKRFEDVGALLGDN